jgi:hypothetical protein
MRRGDTGRLGWTGYLGLGLLLSLFMTLGVLKTMLKGATVVEAVAVGVVWFLLYSLIVFFYWLVKARHEQ